MIRVTRIIASLHTRHCLQIEMHKLIEHSVILYVITNISPVKMADMVKYIKVVK